MKRTLSLSAVSLLLAACSSSSSHDQSQIGQTGLALTVDLTGKSDVGQFLYEVTPVDCETGVAIGPTRTEERELEPTKIPGGIENLENAPLDKDSEHIFADAFLTTEPGCYDVTAIPLTADGEPSATCAVSFKNGVEVLEAATTEIFLLSQCRGRDPGSIDAIVALNHEPEITDLSFPDSKFGTCGTEHVVCITATDVDFDPLQVAWELSPDSPAAAGPTLVSRDYDAATGTLSECVSFVPSEEGKYDVTAKVYDLVHKDDALVNVEDWLLIEGYPNESHGEHNFFFYAGDCDGDSGSGGTSGTGGSSGGSGGSSSGGTGGSTGGTGGASGGTGGSTGGSGGTTADTRYDIELIAVNPLDPAIEAAFENAVSRLEAIVTDDLLDSPPLNVPAGACGTPHPALTSKVFDDLTIFVHFASIDGRGGILAQAGPCGVRPGILLPFLGTMTFDADDLDFAVSEGLLEGIILHEMAHALGFGTLWNDLGLLENAGTIDPTFNGANALMSFDAVGGASYPGVKVPVENTGGPGTAGGHFRESIMAHELMTGYANAGVDNPFSEVSVAALEDMGYGVNMSAAEPYTIPSGSFFRIASTDAHLEDDLFDGPRFSYDESGELVQQ